MRFERLFKNTKLPEEQKTKNNYIKYFSAFSSQRHFNLFTFFQNSGLEKYDLFLCVTFQRILTAVWENSRTLSEGDPYYK